MSANLSGEGSIKQTGTKTPVHQSQKIGFDKPLNEYTRFEIALMFINACVCILYASTEHDTSLDHPFLYAFATAFRMTFYILGGRLIGNFLPLVGDISIIGALGTALIKILFI